MITLPAFLTEFLFYAMHLSLYKTPLTKQSSKPDMNSSKSDSESSTNSLETHNHQDTSTTTPGTESVNGDFLLLKHTMTKKEIRFNRLQFVLNKNVNLTSLYLLFISVFSFSIMSLCSTYNFHTLCLFLMITFINTFFHVHFFYPNLMNIFGTCWTNLRMHETNLSTN